MISKFFLIFILFWMIPGSRTFVRRLILSRILIGIAYYTLICLIPLISILFAGDFLGRYLYTVLYFLGFWAIGLLFIYRQSKGKQKVYLFILPFLFISLIQIPEIIYIGFDFGQYTARYDIFITANLICLLTEKKVSVGLNKKNSLMSGQNFIALLLFASSVHFLTAEFFGILGKYGIQTLESNFLFNLIFFYLVILMYVAKYLIFEGTEKLFGDFPLFVYFLLSTVLIFLFMFFSVENSGEIMVYIASFSLFLTFMLWSNYPIALTWLISTVIIIVSCGLFEFKFIPGL